MDASTSEVTSGSTESNAEIKTIIDLLRLDSDENPWIVDKLLRRGAQVLLAGPPKSGKSLVANDIALAIARPFKKDEVRYLFGHGVKPHGKDEPEPPFQIHRPLPKNKGDQPGWRVLCFSLEMQPGEVSERLKKQLGGYELPCQKLGVKDNPPELQFTLDTIFGLRRPKSGDGDPDSQELIQDLQIVSVKQVNLSGPLKPEINETYFEELKAIIDSQKPDVVIYDTLIQMHDVDENNNVFMKMVMRTIRRFTVIPDKTGGKEKPVAHIILHHTRKENAHFSGPLTADIMRGAGAVHAVADLVILIRPFPELSKFAPAAERNLSLEVHVSSRHSSVDNFTLVRNSDTLTYRWAPTDKTQKPDAIAKKTAAATLVVSAFLKEKNVTERKGFVFQEDTLEQLVTQVTKGAGVKTGGKFIVKELMKKLNEGLLLCRLRDGSTLPKKAKSPDVFTKQLPSFAFHYIGDMRIKNARRNTPKGFRTYAELYSALKPEVPKKGAITARKIK